MSFRLCLSGAGAYSHVMPVPTRRFDGTDPGPDRVRPVLRTLRVSVALFAAFAAALVALASPWVAAGALAVALAVRRVRAAVARRRATDRLEGRVPKTGACVDR